MSKSLNHYASRIANIVGQPNNQALKERAKDMIKDYYAKYIIQSIDRNGISDFYKTSLRLNLIGIEETTIVNELYNIWGVVRNGVWVRISGDNEDTTFTNTNGDIISASKHPSYKVYTEYKTTTKVPRPMNIKNDTTFTKVSLVSNDILTAKLYTYVSGISYLMSVHSPPTRNSRVYKYVDNVIYVRDNNTYQNTSSLTGITTKKIEVEGIWESPEEVIGYYDNTDNQDLALPFPNEMMQMIVAEILKTEFGLIPKDVEVPKEPIVPQTNN